MSFVRLGIGVGFEVDLQVEHSVWTRIPLILGILDSSFLSPPTIIHQGLSPSLSIKS